ncbi:hypothetical protein N1851_028351 [Merluccius polli]|uniref:THAP-type domain-containing protein n=1 Tax=Merluccius polli TaxID=89951 RepID=A0AA47NTL2_MERPO|nr:hypothetical protein N1851_028351 [Merluccius polli]
MALKSSGTTCAVCGCTYNRTKLNNWLKSECFDHKPKKKGECSCPKWYSFHRLPIDDDEKKRSWLKNLNLKYPPKCCYVCSFHFVDKAPTEENPNPTLYLGYEMPPERKRQRVVSVDNSEVEVATTANQAVMVFEQPRTFKDAQTQWMDPAVEDHTYSKGSIISIAEDTLKGDKDCLLYTGIPLLVFTTLVSCLQGFAPQSSTMPAQDQVLLTLMKLRHNFVAADLARRFKRSASQMFLLSTPRTSFHGCPVTQLKQLCQSNTVKYLVAIAPSGMIMFISEAFGGKCSDRYIKQNSGFLDCLRPDDVVMGDRGFTIRDLVEERRVRLVIPAFTRKHSQLTNEQVTQMRRIANVRIHVERAIRRLKLYKILSQTVPISIVPKMDKILQICAALVNLRGDLISSK